MTFWTVQFVGPIVDRVKPINNRNWMNETIKLSLSEYEQLKIGMRSENQSKPKIDKASIMMDLNNYFSSLTAHIISITWKVGIISST